MARPRTAAAGYQPVTIRFPKDILEQCRAYAVHEDRSLNEQLLHIVKAWLLGKKEAKRVPSRLKKAAAP